MKFKGGVGINHKGYLRLTAGLYENQLVHRLVAEGILGRELLPSEDVHHRDGDRKNPKWWNLQVIDHTEHGYISAAQAQFMKRKEAQDKKEWEEYFNENTDKESTDDFCGCGIA